jgi:sec-independent protein translocase protein TatB
MFGLGFTEVIFLAVLILIVIGPKQLPEVAKTIGRFLNEIKRSTDSVKSDFLGSDFENPLTKLKDDLKNEVLKAPERPIEKPVSGNIEDKKPEGSQT